jgi:mono/diheme cytochrome c family protein
MKIDLSKIAVGTILLLLMGIGAQAADTVLKIALKGQTRSFSAATLLARKDITTLTIANDVAYKKSMTYKAVPLLALLGEPDKLTFDTLQAAATDGFVSQLPMSLVKRGAAGGAVAWIAVEPPGKPWPKIPKKDISAGPFFLVWQSPEKSNVAPGQWPYALASLTGVRSPMQRWPQIAVPSSFADKTQEQQGLRVYIKHCLTCHQLDGGGEAAVGPDLMKPMPAVEYMTEKGLRALIRNPAAVRSWPKQQMTGFAKKVLSDIDLDSLMAYLKFKASAGR